MHDWTYTFLLEILPRAQQKEDILLSVHVPTSLDAVSVSYLYSWHFSRLLFSFSLNCVVFVQFVCWVF